MRERNLRTIRWVAIAFISGFWASPVVADDNNPSAAELTARLNKTIEDGDSAVRLRLSVQSKAGKKPPMQVQVKARRSTAGSVVVYQVFYPKELKGTAFLVQTAPGRPPVGAALTLPSSISKLTASDMEKPVFDSDLVLEDVSENFYRWESQKILGSEKVGRNDCIILESKPGKRDSTRYGSVKSWIDPRKDVPMLVEKYDRSGKVVVRLKTDRVSKNDRTQHVPSRLIVERTGSGTVTEVEGSDTRHDVRHTAKDLSAEGLSNLKLSR